jgi:Rhs element Vgr protein
MPRLLPIEQNTDLVTFKIEVNDAPLPATVQIYAMEVENIANQIPSACIYVVDGDAALGEWPQSSSEYFIPGNSIKIFAGYHSEDKLIFSGIVTGQCLRVRFQRVELEVMCKHDIVRMSTAPKYRHFSEITDSDAVADILEEYAIDDDLEPTSVTHTDLASFHLSDWDFIVMRMEANGMVCVADEEGLHAFVPDSSTDPVATLQFGANIIEFDADIDGRRQHASAVAVVWDQASQDIVEVQAEDPAWSVPGNFDPATIALSEEYLRHYGPSMSSDEVQVLADALLLRSRMSFIRGRARVQGLAVAKPGVMMELAGFGDRFNGPVWIGAIRHEISLGNWISDIEFGLPDQWHSERYHLSSGATTDLLPSISGLQTGIVTALEGDPADEKRIRVRIPAIVSDGDGLWARIALMDAGSKRGAYFLPEIDDEVIVGFIGNDLRHPIVLGMMHSSANETPVAPSDDNHIKGYYSRSGMRIFFDDEKKVMTLDTPGKRKIVLDDDKRKLSLADGNGNKIELSSAGIHIQSGGDLVLKASQNLKAEGSVNLELKAGAQWKAEGSAGTELNSSALTVIKGSLVQIN